MINHGIFGILNATMGVITLYGIPNCDTTKKAIAFLNKSGVDFVFHNYKQEGITRPKLEAWFKQTNWESLFNKRSTTWRGLPEAVQKKADNPLVAIKLMQEYNSIIKRPVIEFDKGVIIGYNETEITKQLKLRK